MNLHQFKRFIEAIQSYHEKEITLSNAIEPFNSSYTIIEFCPEMVASILSYMNEYFEDEGDWIGYWLYELDYGTREDLMNGCEYKNGDPIDISTVEKLYNFLIENKSK